jgi:hypothetical protein
MKISRKEMLRAICLSGPKISRKLSYTSQHVLGEYHGCPSDSVLKKYLSPINAKNVF